MNILGTNDHPFYKPLWRRIAIIVVTAVWAAIEVFVAGDALWGTLALGVLAYSVWMFLITFPKDTPPV